MRCFAILYMVLDFAGYLPASAIASYPCHWPTTARPPPPPPPPAPSPPRVPPLPASWATTGLQTGAIQPVDYNSMLVSTAIASPKSANYRNDLADPQGRAAMADDYRAHRQRDVASHSMTSSRQCRHRQWTYKHKYNDNRSFTQPKAH